jgi:hypothetical protein
VVQKQALIAVPDDSYCGPLQLREEKHRLIDRVLSLGLPPGATAGHGLTSHIAEVKSQKDFNFINVW